MTNGSRNGTVCTGCGASCCAATDSGLAAMRVTGEVLQSSSQRLFVVTRSGSTALLSGTAAAVGKRSGESPPCSRLCALALAATAVVVVAAAAAALADAAVRLLPVFTTVFAANLAALSRCGCTGGSLFACSGSLETFVAECERRCCPGLIGRCPLTLQLSSSLQHGCRYRCRRCRRLQCSPLLQQQ
jgi:hypothetical protein